MIVIENACKSFGETKALDSCNLQVDAGSFFVLIGPSGCGKSTLLRTINGLIPLDSGMVRVRGTRVGAQSAERLRRSIGYVIQNVGLFPHWTIAANVLAVPNLLRWKPARMAARLDEIVDLLRIDLKLLARYPHQLSGGQRQRIGVARALAAAPDLVLMDEPFSALDPVSRVELQGEMRRIHARSGTSIVMVTHDVGEALSLATHLAIMHAGRAVQTGTPAALLASPADAFVAKFLGGSERYLHLLDLTPVNTLAGDEQPLPDFPRIGADASLRMALSLMIETGAVTLAVIHENGALRTLRLQAFAALSHHG